MQYVRDIAYEYASYYNMMVEHHAPEMERQDFLLDVKSRQTRLRHEVGEAYAREFGQAFEDSISYE